MKSNCIICSKEFNIDRKGQQCCGTVCGDKLRIKRQFEKKEALKNKKVCNVGQPLYL